ncbi:hypothetical protein [Streptomyces sp. NPDC012825]|uniref:hypothetical protein n=1 Tax=Streptomyces sp. NPDC012825 TaxID=3364851 RepID=UPI0036A1B8DB
MATWREQLDQAQGWKEYRQALRTLRETAGVPFDKLPERSRDIARRHPQHLRSYDSTNTFSQLLDRRLPDTRPEWHKVELLVRICAEHQGIEDTTSFARKWADAYRRCGGDPGERFPPQPRETSAPVAPPVTGAERTDVHSGEKEPLPVPGPVPPEGDFVPGRPWWKSKPALATATVLVLAAVVLGSMKLGTLLTDDDTAMPPSGKAGTPTPTAGVTGGSSAPPASPGTGDATEQSTPANTSPPGVSGVDAAFAWSNDGGGGGSQSDIVKVSSSYRKGEDPGKTWDFNRGDTLVVQCQVTGGRPVKAGTAYPGPDTARERGLQGIWYRMTSPVQAWAPAVYVDTGRDSLPAC